MKCEKYLLLFLILLLAGCDKDLKITAPEFEVTTDAPAYKAGEEVTFVFTGQADNISFYSGEPGADYANREEAGPDRPIPVKAKYSGEVLTYSYTYDQSGQYNVVFVASNNNYSGSIEVVKSITITITE